MSAWLALLRGVNVGGRGKLAMAELQGLAAGLGWRNPRTWLQSGNLVFHADGAEAGGLARTLEAALKAQAGLDTFVVVRDLARWEAALAANPFGEMAANDPSHLLVVALESRAAPDAETRGRALVTGREQVAVVGDHAYVAYPDGVGDSPLTPARLDKAFGMRGTARNWNTARKLAELLRA